MIPFDAFEMGYDAAGSGFFFDGMELVAALSVRVGGFDPLRHGLELLFIRRDPVGDAMKRVSTTISHGFNRPTPPPTGVDEYRRLLEEGVFEIVNRWSYIGDINQVNRLQAWFYAGFGLGRGTTVIRGMRLIPRLYDVAGDGTELDSMPGRLQRMAIEAAKQMEVAAEEDDLRSVRPLFEDAARRMKHLSMVLHRPVPQVVWSSDLQDDLDVLEDVARKVQLDLSIQR